jgi:LysR family transcriptional regulator, low CO2-responsive transcriptional regulator
MRPDAITLRQLRALIAVERFGSLTGAAGELGLTVPAIHSQIKGLEIALDCPVVRRKADNAGSTLTVEGQAVLDAAMRIEGVLSQCATEVLAISRGLTGRVTLGVVSTGKYFAPWLVKRLRETAPGVEIALRVGNRETIIAGLDQGTLDLGIMGRPPRHPVVEAEPLGAHPHGLLVAPDHPLADGRPADLDELLDNVFLSREEGSGTRILMTRYLDRIGEGRVIEFLVMDSNETIKQAAMAGLGVAFLSLHTVTEEITTGRLIRVNAPGLPITRQWYLVQPVGKEVRAVVTRCKDQIIALKGTYLPTLGER